MRRCGVRIRRFAPIRRLRTVFRMIPAWLNAHGGGISGRRPVRLCVRRDAEDQLPDDKQQDAQALENRTFHAHSLTADAPAGNVVSIAVTSGNA